MMRQRKKAGFAENEEGRLRWKWRSSDIYICNVPTGDGKVELRYCRASCRNSDSMVED
jgi:hypothetical protein